MNELHCEHGRIWGEISESSVARRSAELMLTIEARRDAGGKLTLRARELAMRKWSDLENRQFSYPAEKVTGYVDGDEIEIGARATGTLHRGGQTHDVRATALSFGRISENGIPVRMLIQGADVEPLAVEATLAIGGITVRGDIAKIHPIQREPALAMAARFLDLGEFAEAGEGEFLSLRPKAANLAPTPALPRE